MLDVPISSPVSDHHTRWFQRSSSVLNSQKVRRMMDEAASCVTYLTTAWAVVAILTGSASWLDASPTRNIAAIPRRPGWPVNVRWAGQVFVTVPVWRRGKCPQSEYGTWFQQAQWLRDWLNRKLKMCLKVNQKGKVFEEFMFESWILNSHCPIMAKHTFPPLQSLLTIKFKCSLPLSYYIRHVKWSMIPHLHLHL